MVNILYKEQVRVARSHLLAMICQALDHILILHLHRL